MISEIKFSHFTSVDDGFPLVELALVWHGVEVTTLDVSEAGQVMRTWCGVTDLVAPSLSQTILPSVLRTVSDNERRYFSVVSSRLCSKPCEISSPIFLVLAIIALSPIHFILKSI